MSDRKTPSLATKVVHAGKDAESDKHISEEYSSGELGFGKHGSDEHGSCKQKERKNGQAFRAGPESIQILISMVVLGNAHGQHLNMQLPN